MFSSVHKTFRDIYGRVQNVGRKWRKEKKKRVFYFTVEKLAVAAKAAVIITAFWQ